MTIRKYSSRSQQTTLASTLTSGATTMIVVSGSNLMGGKTPTVGETYTVVIDPDTALEEIVDVSNYTTGNTLTITRGVDGSSAVAHSAGAVVRHMAIGRDYREANDHINSTTTAHGLTLANLISTTDTSKVTGALIVDGAVGTAKIDNTAVTEAKIGTAAVTTTKIADSAITSAKIADGTIATGDIADGAVTSAKIADLTIATSDIADGAITSAKILDGTIATGDLADGSVTSAKIADATIVDGDISATAAIAKSKLNLGGTITSADIVDGTIVNSDISASAGIALSKLAVDPLSRANHTGTQTASTISDFDSQVNTHKVTDLAAPTGSFSMNNQKITNLGTPTTTTDAATKNYVDTQVSAIVNGAPATLDTLKEIADAISSGGTFYDAVVLKGGSTMTGPLVLNADPSVNLGAATKQYVDAVAGSATAAAASAAAAATTYDNFDDRYLGAKASAPTLDNDGNALITGALYWNSTANAMFAWSGTAWGSISSTADIFRFKYTATGGETTKSGMDDNGITLSYLPGKEQVYLNGVLLVRNTDYTATSGSSITSLAALVAGDILEIITFTAFDLATAISNTILDAKGDLIVASGADTPGKLPAGTNGYFLQADSTQTLGLKWAAVDLSSYATTSSVTTVSNTVNDNYIMSLMGAI